jgi:nicotinate-nucleotide--dimethylbenzimidazole phosphoribosyltransferase
VLSKVGGFELAGLIGVILGAAAHRIPVILDGYISGAVALLAVKLVPATRDYMLAGHLSSEGGHRQVLQLLDLSPLLQLDMRLGEGTGAILAMQIVEAALKLHRLMPTWDDAAIFDYPSQIADQQ